VNAAGHAGEGQGLAARVVTLLAGRGETLAVAESCTGGGLGETITAVPGSSAVFWGGVIAYAASAKTELLQVSPALLETHGAVSGEAALAMATGIRRRSGATWGVAVTGIAGPGGGTPVKPVGTVWFAVQGPRVEVSRQRFSGKREEVRRASIRHAVEMLARLCAVSAANVVSLENG